MMKKPTNNFTHCKLMRSKMDVFHVFCWSGCLQGALSRSSASIMGLISQRRVLCMQTGGSVGRGLLHISHHTVHICRNVL